MQHAVERQWRLQPHGPQNLEGLKPQFEFCVTVDRYGVRAEVWTSGTTSAPTVHQFESTGAAKAWCERRAEQIDAFLPSND